MSGEKQPEKSPAKDRDERVAIPLDPEEALRGLLKVDPESEPEESGERSERPSPPS
jgi:hypothetical protein